MCNSMWRCWVCLWGQRSYVACCGTWGLEVERDHLAACVPEDLRHVITGVYPTPFGVDTAHLTLVVAVLTLRKIWKKRGRACVFQHMCVCVCVRAHLSACACVCQTGWRTIFSVNSLGQAVPLERDRQSVCECQAKLQSPKAHEALEASSSFLRAERKQTWRKTSALTCHSALI